MRNRFLPLAASATLAIIFVLPRPSSYAQNKTLRIGFNAPDLSQTQYAYALSLLRKEGEAMGVTIFAQDGKGKASQQMDDLMNTVNMGLDGVILVPNDDQSLSGTVNDVLAAHTPVVTIVHRLNNVHQPLSQLGNEQSTAGLNTQAKEALRALVSFARDNKPLQTTSAKQP